MTLGVEPCGVVAYIDGDCASLKWFFDLDNSSSDIMTYVVSIFKADWLSTASFWLLRFVGLTFSI